MLRPVAPLCLAVCLAASPALVNAQEPQPAPEPDEQAQPESPQAPPIPGDPEAAPESPAPPALPAPAANPAPADAPAEPPAVPAAPPILFVPMQRGAARGARVSIPASSLIALRSRLDEVVVRRAVTDATEEQVGILSACGDTECVRASLTAWGVSSAVIVRANQASRDVRRISPTAVLLRLEVVGAGEEAPLVRPAELVVVPGEAEEAATLASLIEGIWPGLPAPPARTTLMIVVNVEGADIRVDGEPAGQSPIPPLDVIPGEHLIQVQREGYVSRSGRLQVAAGEAARIDVLLEPDRALLLMQQQAEEEAEAASSSDGPFYTRWYVLAGAGAVVVTAVVVAVVLATGTSSEDRAGFPVPPIL